MPGLRQDKRFVTASAPELGWTGIAINTMNGPGAKLPLAQLPLLRMAFELSLDREVINQVVTAAGIGRTRRS
jgi:peptide/nickel transport system substrate-binding protein